MAPSFTSYRALPPLMEDQPFKVSPSNKLTHGVLSFRDSEQPTKKIMVAIINEIFRIKGNFDFIDIYF
jgi:hypothetical protein